MAYDGSLIFDTSINTRGFTSGLDSIKGKMSGLSSAVKKLGALVVSAFAVKSLVDFGREAIELGSNVTEVQNVVDVAFGEMSYKVEAFADSAIENFGMSQLAAKKTASTYMAMAKNMGLSMDTASDMAITLAGLTGDVASFYNISQDLADTKLKSVFTGETETLKDLGIVMTQANLEAYALANGINKSISEMSQAELVMLRYNFVVEQLSMASGDFVRTQDSWANQTRILSMQWQEFMSIIGQALVQVLLPVVKALNSIVSALINMANAFNAAITSIFGGAQTQINQTQNQVNGVASGIEEAVGNQNDLTEATKETNKEQKKSITAFDEINKLSSQNAGATGGTAVVGGIGESGLQTITTEVSEPKGGEKLLRFFSKLREAIEPTWRSLQNLWTELQKVGSFVGDSLVDFYHSFLAPVGNWVLGEGLPRLVDALANGLAQINWEPISSALHDIWTALAPFSQKVGDGLLWLWENVLVPYGTWVVNNVVPLFLERIATTIDILNAAIDIIKPGAKWLWENFLQPVAKWAGDVFINAIKTINGLFEILAGLLTGDMDRAMKGFDQVIQGVSGHFDLMKDAANAAWNLVVSVFGAAADWFKRNVTDPIASNFKSFINSMISFAESFANFFIRGVNGIISAFNSISVSIPDWVPRIGGNTFGVNIPYVPEIQLPRLATGAVIPPNREFMAVLGDQKNGTNIEAPLETIVQAFRQAMSEMGYNGQGEAILEVDGQKFGKLVYKYNNKESRRVGTRLVEV